MTPPDENINPLTGKPRRVPSIAAARESVSTTTRADDLLQSLLLPDARQELHAAMKAVRLLDLTLPEVHGLLAILEAALERADSNKAAVLELVRR